jgi:hypothetical protein
MNRFLAIALAFVFAYAGLSLYLSRGRGFFVPRVLAQVVYQQQCPAGMNPLFPTQFRASTGAIVQPGCFDLATGNYMFAGVVHIAPTKSDLGAQITAGIAALPTQATSDLGIAGSIQIAPEPGGGCYVQSSPVHVTKLVRVSGSTGSVPCIIYTGTTGALFSVDWSGAVVGGVGGGIDNLQLLGQCQTNACPSNNSVAIQLGPSAGAAGASFHNIKIGIQTTQKTPPGCSGVCGFAEGINIGTGIDGGAALGVSFYDLSVFGSNVGININTNNENVKWYGGFIAQNAVGVRFGPKALGDYYFDDQSFDDNGVAFAAAPGGNMAVTLVKPHFENAGRGPGASPYVDARSGVWTLRDGIMMEDRANDVTNPGFISFRGAYLSIFGTQVIALGGSTIVTQVVNATAGNVLMFGITNLSPSQVLQDINPSFLYAPARVLDVPLNAGANSTQSAIYQFWRPGVGPRGNNDSIGTITVPRAMNPTGSFNFSRPYSQVPKCTLTPTSPLNGGTGWFVTQNTGTVTANVIGATAGPITFNYNCSGNPN